METKTPHLEDVIIQQTFEQHGVQFVNRSYGKATTKTVSLDCIVKATKIACMRLFLIALQRSSTNTGNQLTELKAKIEEVTK